MESKLGDYDVVTITLRNVGGFRSLRGLRNVVDAALIDAEGIDSGYDLSISGSNDKMVKTILGGSNIVRNRSVQPVDVNEPVEKRQREVEIIRDVNFKKEAKVIYEAFDVDKRAEFKSFDEWWNSGDSLKSIDEDL